MLNRNFNATAPNQKWLTDISEFQLPACKVILSPMIDCFDGMVVSWPIGTRPNAELVNTMLDAAIAKLNDSEAQPMAHSATEAPTIAGQVGCHAALMPSWCA